MSGSLVALTGTTGFVGRHILTALRSADIPCRVLVRTPGKLPAPDDSVEIVRGPLEDRDALARLFLGASSVVHCAGVVRGVTQAHFDAVNALAAGECASLAAEAGVKRFLLISSLAAREPGLSPYAASKRRGEEAVISNAGPMGVTIIRPPAVYGPGDREMLPLFRLMARGIAPVFGARNARFSLIYVEDLAAAVVAWERSGGSPRGLLEIDDANPGGYGWDDVCEAVATITGRRVRQIPLPAVLLGVPAALNTAAGLASGYAPMLSLGKLRELRHPDWVCRASPLPPGWQPAHRLAEGLKKTPGWRD